MATGKAIMHSHCYKNILLFNLKQPVQQKNKCKFSQEIQKNIKFNIPNIKSSIRLKTTREIITKIIFYYRKKKIQREGVSTSSSLIIKVNIPII